MTEVQHHVLINKNDLSRLATEVAQLRRNLPLVVNSNTSEAVGKVERLEKEINQMRTELKQRDAEVKRLSKRCEDSIVECQKEKQENVRLRSNVQELSSQLLQQSEYCSSLGMTCCTILWRVSRCEDSIQAILLGSKTNEFLALASNTLQSYVAAYKEDWPDENMEESQFILALCGIITNIAASAFGRDFLVTNEHGKQLVDVYISTLGEAPCGKSARLKNLLLMALYNLSINQKGFSYLLAKPGLSQLLVWLLKEEKDPENQLNTLRIVQSIVCDEEIRRSFHNMVPMPLLLQFTDSKNSDIRQLASEIISELQNHL